MNAQTEKRNMTNPAAFIGKRVDPSRWTIPAGYDRCEMTGKLYPHNQLEHTFRHWVFNRDFLAENGIYVEDAAWLSAEGYDLIMTKLDDLGVLGAYREAVDHEQDFIEGRCEIGAAGLVWTNQAPAAAVTTSSAEQAADVAPARLPVIFFNGLVLTIDGEEVALLYRDGRFGFYTDEQHLNPILAALAERFDEVTADRKELAPGLVNYRVSFKARPATAKAQKSTRVDFSHIYKGAPVVVDVNGVTVNATVLEPSANDWGANGAHESGVLVGFKVWDPRRVRWARFKRLVEPQNVTAVTAVEAVAVSAV